MKHLVLCLASSVAAPAALSGALVACGGDDSAVSAARAQSASSGTGVQDAGGIDATVADAGTPSSDPDGTWSGYIENYTFPSGSDSIVLTFTHQPDGGVTGNAVFGSVPFYPPPTDPDVGYPDTDLDADYTRNSLEGFRYTLLEGTLVGPRLRATVDPDELYAQWCALQTSYPEGLPDGGTGAYTCYPPAASVHDPRDSGLPDGCYIFGDGGSVTPIACLNFQICDELALCACTQAGCTSAVTPPTAGDQSDFQDVVVDLQVDGANAAGSIQLPNGNPHNTYLTRQ